MRILVFGAGGFGTLVSGLLASVHDATLVARGPHTARMSTAGLDIIGVGSVYISPATTMTNMGHSVDLALATVKPFDTAAAADVLADCDVDVMPSLQNGLIEETLVLRLNAPVLAGTVIHGARLAEPGCVECTGVGRIVLGAFDGGPGPLAERVGKASRDARLNTPVATDIPWRHWEKLAVSAGISAVTALVRIRNGALVGDDAGEPVHRAARETARVVRLERVSLPNCVAREAVDRVVEKTAANRSPMLQDIAAEKRTEVGIINGAVVDIAADHDFEVPTSRTLVAPLRVWERGAGLR